MPGCTNSRRAHTTAHTRCQPAHPGCSAATATSRPGRGGERRRQQQGPTCSGAEKGGEGWLQSTKRAHSDSCSPAGSAHRHVRCRRSAVALHVRGQRAQRRHAAAALQECHLWPEGRCEAAAAGACSGRVPRHARTRLVLMQRSASCSSSSAMRRQRLTSCLRRYAPCA